MDTHSQATVSRRRLLGAGAALTGTALGATLLPTAVSAEPERHRPVRPPKLVPGDRVRVVAPGSSPSTESMAIGISILESWGLVVELGEHVWDKYGYLAARDADRIADLNAAFADPDVRGVFAARGGYGTTRIIDGLDHAAVRADPKLLVGYSDITALHLALHRKAGLASLHSPMVNWSSSNNTEATKAAMKAAIMGTDDVVLTRDPSNPTSAVEGPGTATGRLYGGNLSLLAAERRNLPDLRGAILFIEDVDEDPYRIDGMLTELRRGRVLDGIAGVAVGQFTDAEELPDEWTVAEALADRLGDLGVPVIGGLPIGHGADPRVLPLGVPAAIDTAAGTLTVEAAVA